MTTNSGSKSKLEDVLKGEKATAGQPSQGDSGTVLHSALERELGAVDEELAKELQRTRAEEIIERRRIAIERMRGGSAASERGSGKTEGQSKDWLTDMAQGLLERGMDPAVVGRTIDYLIGNSSFPAVGLPGNGSPSGGMSFTDMKELFKMGQESNRTDATLVGILNKLSEKIESVEKLATARPPAQPEKRVAYVIEDGEIREVPFDRPILLKAPPAADTGESIEMLKEKNRHEEEKAKIELESNYKKSVAETLASIPEKIGRGLASQALGEEDGTAGALPGGAAAQTIELEKIQCPDEKCGKEFTITKGALKVTCPHCGGIYTRDEKK